MSSSLLTGYYANGYLCHCGVLVSNTKNYNKIQGIKKLIQYKLD
jgi:hypothetical protein